MAIVYVLHCQHDYDGDELEGVFRDIESLEATFRPPMHYRPQTYCVHECDLDGVQPNRFVGNYIVATQSERVTDFRGYVDRRELVRELGKIKGRYPVNLYRLAPGPA